MSDFFYNAMRRDIAMIQGDTMSFAFQVQGLGGQIPSDIVFTCKETPDTEDALFSASLGGHIAERSYDAEHDIRTYVLRIPPELTQGVALGRYFYDIEFTVNNDVLTLMRGRLSLEYQITGGGEPPEPEYENGDNVNYPIDNIPVGSIKIYTEQYINNLIEKIREIQNTTDKYSTETADTAITQIQTQIVYINEAINTATGGSGTIPLSDMAAAIGNLPQNGIKALEFDLTFSTYTTT